MVTVDLGNGKLLAMAEIDEKEKRAVTVWLKTLKQKHRIGAIVADDLASYKEITDQLELGHQVCQLHVRRWVGQTLRKLEEELPEEWLQVLPTIQQLMDELLVNGSKVLYKLWKGIPGRTTTPDEKRAPLEKLRDLVLRFTKD